MIFKAGHHEFSFPRPALIMGIVNTTPDSFSDGGKFLDPDAAVDHALRLVHEGADILDIGGESTRPGAALVPEPEEIERVVPVIQQLATRVQVPISIDTVKPGVARAAIDAGATIVNDIAANRDDPGIWKLVAETGAGYVAMHMQGTPQTMQNAPAYNEVIGEVGQFFEERMARFADAGIDSDQVMLDVGIGFGKTVAHNLELIRRLDAFHRLDRPLLLGASRKSFMGKLFGLEPAERIQTSIACATWAIMHGVQAIRTHDVAATAQAVRMIEAIAGSSR